VEKAVTVSLQAARAEDATAPSDLEGLPAQGALQRKLAQVARRVDKAVAPEALQPAAAVRPDRGRAEADRQEDPRERAGN